MLFLIVLAVATISARLIHRRGNWRDHARWGMASAMVVAGLAHLARPEPFLQHLPPQIPSPGLVVALSGVVEIALGLWLLTPQPARRWGGRALALYLIGVFPANVYVAVAGVDVTGQPGGAYPWLRLPLQVVFIAWAIWATQTALDSRPRSADRSRVMRGSGGPGPQEG